MPEQQKPSGGEEAIKVSFYAHRTLLDAAERIAKRRGVTLTQVLNEAIQRETTLYPEEERGGEVLVRYDHDDTRVIGIRFERNIIPATARRSPPPVPRDRRTTKVDIPADQHGMGKVTRVDFKHGHKK
jgi:hypothetical protein